jgi:hypothetical protein
MVHASARTPSVQGWPHSELVDRERAVNCAILLVWASWMVGKLAAEGACWIDRIVDVHVVILRVLHYVHYPLARYILYAS